MNDPDKPADSDEFDTIDPDDPIAPNISSQSVDEQNNGDGDGGAVVASDPPATVDEYETIDDGEGPYDPHATIESTELPDPFDTLDE